MTPKHYNNSNGSIYKFCIDHELNAYEFEIIKRIARCRKKRRVYLGYSKNYFSIRTLSKRTRRKFQG